jgi:hypothetical protein
METAKLFSQILSWHFEAGAKLEIYNRLRKELKANSDVTATIELLRYYTNQPDINYSLLKQFGINAIPERSLL